MISNSPYWFSRIYKTDKVVIGLDLPKGTKEVNVSGIFENGTK
jgi:alpha-amylase